MSCVSFNCGDRLHRCWAERGPHDVLLVSVLVVALLSAIAAGTLAACGHTLSFNELQWIQLPLATLVLSLVVAVVAYCKRREVQKVGAAEEQERTQVRLDGAKRWDAPEISHSQRGMIFTSHIHPEAPHSVVCLGRPPDGDVDLRETVRFESESRVSTLYDFYLRRGMKLESAQHRGAVDLIANWNRPLKDVTRPSEPLEFNYTRV